MGGSFFPVSLLDKEPNLDQLIVTEDDFIRDQRSKSGATARVQTLLEPIWHFRSEFNDAISLMEHKLDPTEHDSQTTDIDFEDDTPANVHDHNHHNFDFLISECVAAANLYLTFINKIRRLEGKVRIFWKSTSSHTQEILEAFIEDEENPDFPDQIHTALFESKISYLVGMAEAMMEALRGSLISAQRTWQHSMDTLRSVSKYFYKNQIPLPSESLCRNYLMFYWHQFEEDMKLKDTNNVMG